ncbi:hypothetical protein P3S68_004317 [Capsicum galapagoense]
MNFPKPQIFFPLLLSFTLLLFTVQAINSDAKTSTTKKVVNCLPSELMHLASACFPVEETHEDSEDLCCELVKSVTYDLKECLCTAATINRIIVGRDRRVSKVVGRCTGGATTARHHCFTDL